MFTEKLKSLLRFGPISTRYKDIFDMYYLSANVDYVKLTKCIEYFIFKDNKMRETNMADIIKRVQISFSDKNYIHRIESSKARWLDEDVATIVDAIVVTLNNCR